LSKYASKRLPQTDGKDNAVVGLSVDLFGGLGFMKHQKYDEDFFLK
jgi:hypothetical protein